MAAARDLIPTLKAASPRHESEKRISPEIAAQLRALGFFRITQSTENSGWGMRPSTLWRVTRELARGDGATAWIHGLAGLHPWLVGMFPLKAQDEVFVEGRDAVVIALTGNVGRNVQAVEEGDGLRVTGKWAYASGIDIADWACPLVEVNTGNQKEMRLLLVPKSSFRIDHSSWNVLGMRGTGSKDVYLDGELVPVHRSLLWTDVQQGRFPGSIRNKGPMYNIPHTSLFVLSVAAPIVGVGCGLLDLYMESVQKRVPAGVGAPQIEDRFALADLGRAASDIESAFTLLIQAADALYDQAERGENFTLAQRAQYRMTGATIVDMVLSAGDRMVRGLGGSLLPQGPLERGFRDLHSMASHFLIQATPSAELLGRVLLGQPIPANARL